MDPMTYDDIAEVYRAETKRPILADLRDTWWSEAEDFLARTTAEARDLARRDPAGIMTQGALSRLAETGRMLDSIRTARCEKIVRMACSKVLIGGDRPVKGMAVEDQRLYMDIQAVVGEYRNRTLGDGERKGASRCAD